MIGYLSFFKTRLINGLQYRSAAFAGILTQVFWGFLNTMVFISFYSHISPDNVNISLPQLITYIWLNQAFLKLIFVYIKDEEIMNTIKNGAVAYELCRPYNLYNWWFVKLTSDKYSSVLLRFLPIIVMGLFLPHPYTLELPYSMLSFLLFIFSLVIGSLLLITIHLLILSIGFFTNEDKGIAAFIFIIADLFSGGIVPLPLMPNIVQKIGMFCLINHPAFLNLQLNHI